MTVPGTPFALLVAALGTIEPVPPASDGISALRAAAVTYDEQTAGYMVDHVIETIHAQGGFIHFDRVERRLELRKDGDVIAEKSLESRGGGNVPSQIGKTHGSGAQQPARHFVFSNRYIQEYHLSNAPCVNCADGERDVSFYSDTHDVNHSTGNVILDRHGRIRSVTYHPYVLPDRRMDSGTMTITFGRLADDWLPVRCQLAFTAHYLLIHGSGTLELASDSAKRYPSYELASAAFDNSD
jgi:hypothetical protein